MHDELETQEQVSLIIQASQKKLIEAVQKTAANVCRERRRSIEGMILHRVSDAADKAVDQARKALDAEVARAMQDHNVQGEIDRVAQLAHAQIGRMMDDAIERAVIAGVDKALSGKFAIEARGIGYPRQLTTLGDYIAHRAEIVLSQLAGDVMAHFEQDSKKPE